VIWRWTGGIDPNTAPLVTHAGANVLVAGTAIFGDSNGIAAAMERLRDGVGEVSTGFARNSRDEHETTAVEARITKTEPEK
jgi:hypothetical protein